MADNVLVTAGSGTTLATLQNAAGEHHTVGVLAYPTTISDGANVLQIVTTAFGLPVAVQSSALPSGAATSVLQTSGNASLTSIDAKVPALGQALAAASVPVVLTATQLSTLTPPAAISGFATQATLATLLTESTFDAKVGSLAEAAPASDTASSGLNGRLQRVAQRLTSLIALLPASIGQKVKTASLPVVIASDQDALATTVNASTSGGWTPHNAIAAATTNATSVKASAGQVGGYAIFNKATSNRYVKLYDKASAPTVGTDTPVTTILVPAGGGAILPIGAGIVFAVGIAYAITTGIEVTDATAVTLSDVSVNLYWK